MKKISRRILTLAMVITMTAVFTINAFAATKLTRLGISKNDTDRIAMSIAEGLTYSYLDTDTFQECAGYLTREEYDIMASKLMDGKKTSEGSYLKDSSIMYCGPALTSTKDTVILVTLKVDYVGYNLIYCVELHINNEGKIYGHNIWVV